jgi:arylamine N-acetyltransferase
LTVKIEQPSTKQLGDMNNEQTFQTSHPLSWCRSALQGHRHFEVIVSLYTRHDPRESTFELGVSIAAGPFIRFLPLTYTEYALSSGAIYAVYACVADQYASYLRDSGFNARRVLAPFENGIRSSESTPLSHARFNT